ncbi:hypothetical protein C8R46DRAFT_1229845 [Mycena filopes]|nr:hypothetical protein C8R46DRAFT_1229845 [Mycena filopes]
MFIWLIHSSALPRQPSGYNSLRLLATLDIDAGNHFTLAPTTLYPPFAFDADFDADRHHSTQFGTGSHAVRLFSTTTTVDVDQQLLLRPSNPSL